MMRTRHRFQWAVVAAIAVACGTKAQPKNPMPAPVAGSAAPTTPPAGGKPTGITAKTDPGRPGEALVYQFPDTTDADALKLAQQIANSKIDGERIELEQKLRELLTKQFDDRQRRHEQEIVQLETQVKRLKELIQKRHEKKAEIIDERAKQVIRDAQGLN